MKCEKCGKEYEHEIVFCPFCGERLINNVIDIVDEKTVEPKEKGPWKSFAHVGSVLGKISLCIFWMIGIGTYVGVFGMVFSCLGRKSKIRKEIADTAFKRSLVGTILSLGFISLISLTRLIVEIIQKM